MKTTLIKNAMIINENSKFVSDLLIKEGKIEKIGELFIPTNGAGFQGGESGDGLSGFRG